MKQNYISTIEREYHIRSEIDKHESKVTGVTLTVATPIVCVGLVATADETRKRPGEGKLNLVGCETYAASRHLSPVLRGPRPVKKENIFW